MKKLLLSTLTVLFLATITANAKQVDADKAKNVALQFMQTSNSAKGNTSRSLSAANLELVYTATADAKATATRAKAATNNLFYVFNQQDGKGFVIVAADDAVSPILAYSRENKFCADDMPCNVKAVLDSYREAITAAIDSGADASAEWNNAATAAKASTDGSNLVKTQWDQSYPYNNQAPVLGEEHCLTGCVATAMAQVMNYWQYPQRGTGSNSYYWDGGDQILSTDFSQDFDWSNMLDSYPYDSTFTQAEQDAVAYLMAQCGRSINMAYYRGSGASVSTMRNALIDNFGYSEDYIRSLTLGNTTQAEWLSTIKAEIDAGRPVVYSSSSHAFICDGYDSSNKLHVNFGWSGNSDGYYALMGGDNIYLSASYQNIVYGIIPATKATSLPQTTLEITTNGFKSYNTSSTVAAGTAIRYDVDLVSNTSDCDIDELGVVAVDASGNISSLLGHISFPNSYNYSGGIHFSTSLLAINIDNASNETIILKTMPAYKMDGTWHVQADATPIELNVSPRTTTDKASLVNVYTGNIEIQAGLRTTIYPSVYIKDGFFSGKIVETITNSAGEIIKSDTYEAALSPGTSSLFYHTFLIDEPDTYTLTINAIDDDGTEMASYGATKTIVASRYPSEPYLTSFSIDTSDYGIMEQNDPNYLPFKSGENITVKGSYANMTGSSVTKTIVLTRDDSASDPDIVASQEITIPAGGSTDFTFTATAKGDAPTRSYFYLKEPTKMSNGTYRYYYPTFDLTDSSRPNAYVGYQVETPNMVFTKAPRNYYYEEGLTLHANQDEWIYCFFDNNKLGVSYSTGYRLMSYLYNGSTLVGENTQVIGSVENGYFQLPIKGFDVEPGSYTLKFKFTQRGVNEYDVVDTDGSPVTYTVEVLSPDLLPEQSCILNGNENYSFINNENTLYRGETAKLKYALTNPHSETFRGTIMVKENVSTIVGTPVTSEEKAITIEGNNSENAYGEINVSVPADYRYSSLSYRLYAKSQYDDDYRAISNAYLSVDIKTPSNIDAITANDKISIGDGMIIVDESIANASVCDLSGRAASGYAVSGNAIDLRQLPSGVYIVKIETESKAVVKAKVVK